MRLFVAVDVPAALKEAIEREVVEPLRPGLSGGRWTRPGSRHLTLKFLGEVADDLLESIVDGLEGAARSHAPFFASFEQVGGFPNLRRPRVLWIGIGPGAERLADLARDVEGALEPLGFTPEDRPFRAHFTLARFREPRLVGELPQLPQVMVPTQRFRIGEVVLFRSQLHPKGARYSPMARVQLRS